MLSGGLGHCLILSCGRQRMRLFLEPGHPAKIPTEVAHRPLEVCKHADLPGCDELHILARV